MSRRKLFSSLAPSRYQMRDDTLDDSSSIFSNRSTRTSKGSLSERDPPPSSSPTESLSASIGSQKTLSTDSSLASGIVIDPKFDGKNLYGDARKLVVRYSCNDDDSSKSSSDHMSEESSMNRSRSDKRFSPTVKARVEMASQSLEKCVEMQRQEERRRVLMVGNGKKHVEGMGDGCKILFVSLSSSSIDASDAITLVSSHLLAFRALHRTGGRTVQEHDSILVTNAQSSLGRAVIELATVAGAREIFAVSPKKYHKRLQKLGTKPLDEDGFVDWAESLMGKVDIVIDTEICHATSAATIVTNNFDGKLVRVLVGPDTVDNIRRFQKANDLVIPPRNTYYYSLSKDMERDSVGLRMDLQYLFNMMQNGFIKPKKKRPIPMLGISFVEVRFQIQPSYNKGSSSLPLSPNMRRSSSVPQRRPDQSKHKKMSTNYFEQIFAIDDTESQATFSVESEYDRYAPAEGSGTYTGTEWGT